MPIKNFEHYEGRIKTGEFFKDPKILRMQDPSGTTTIAHEQALEGWTTEDPDILALRDDFGNTVARTQVCACNGRWFTEDPDLLRMQDMDKLTLESVQRDLGWKPKRKAPSKDLEARVVQLERLVKKLLKEKKEC